MSAQSCPITDHNIYWQPWADGDPDGPMPYGDNTAEIIDLSRGGVIAYVHRVNAEWIVFAMRSAEEPGCTCSEAPTPTINN